MDTPLLPKEMGRGPKMALLGFIGLTVVAVIVGIALSIFELGLRPFHSPWIFVGAAVFVILLLTLLLYKWIRTDEDYDEPKYLYLIGVQFFALVVMGCALYGIAFPPSETQFYFVGGVYAGAKGGGGSLELVGTGKKVPLNRDPCTSFNFGRVAEGTSSSVKLTQPQMSICLASGASGTIKSNMNRLNVHCDLSWQISGTVTGATNAGMIMTMVGQNLPIDASQSGPRPFHFKDRIKNGTKYVVTVKTPPTGETCGGVIHGEGVATADVSDISVSCLPKSK